MKESPLNISPVEECILIIVNKSELYGLEIIKALENGSGGKVKIGFGTLYPALRRLEKKEFVETRWGDEIAEERGGARRKYYKISAKGASALEEIGQIRAALMNWQPASVQTHALRAIIS
jgi:PadR family transcriptional regulator, regulatory protein PadR